jgi:metal-dependent amidase/aminoacylase/carboxypeptidase family protein
MNFQMQASADLAIEWHGKSSNAAVAPWAGRSALHASEVFTAAANVMREQVLPSCRLQYYMMEGPSAVNTVPDYVKLGMASEVHPNPGSALMGGSTEVGDVSWSVPTIGAAFAAAPQGIALHTWGGTPCVGMSIGHKAVVQSAKSLAAMGLDLLTQPDLIEAAKKEFDERTCGKPYKSFNELDGPPGGRLEEVALECYECSIPAEQAGRSSIVGPPSSAQSALTFCRSRTRPLRRI